METKYIEQLIRDYDQLLSIPRSAYDLVIPRLRLVMKNKGAVLKRAGQVDLFSRYICEGFVGYYSPSPKGKSLFFIYQSSDSVFDLDSYRTGIASQNELRAISQVVYLEFSVDSENELITKDPNLARLALKVNQRILNRQVRVYEIGRMGFQDGYPALLQLFKGIGMVLSNRDLASFFHVSIRTVERLKPKFS